VLDEPYNALDIEGTALLDATLAEPRTFVVATHAPERLEPLATQRLVLA
jgi:ATPase subunit of ABC transporter with duplicated ATPase domains